MDLKTKYLGLELKHPIIAGASPASESTDKIKQLEDAGAAAVVMHSLFEEQAAQEDDDLDFFMSHGTEGFAEALSYFPQVDEYRSSTDAYMEILQHASSSCDIPVLGSLNGISPKGWLSNAKRMQEAGAKGLELNVYFLSTDLTQDAATVEKRYLDLIAAVRKQVKIPVAVKISPFFSSVANMAMALDRAGADGLVLFNRFYQPDINIDTLEVDRTLQLSAPWECRLPLLWTGLLYGKLNASISATTGVHSAEEAIKYLLAGADTVQLASAILLGGPKAITQVLAGVESWAERRFSSIGEFRGKLSHAAIADPTAYERANYIRILRSGNMVG